MKNHFPFLLLLLLCNCKKTLPVTEPVPDPVNEVSYVKFTIKAGDHYCDKNVLTAISLSEMNFKVKFDSSSIYKTADTLNQYDINKLYGFSEGNDHHYNSARIGWSWNDSALRLYAYTYHNGVRDSKEICTVNIGTGIVCGIKISGNDYIFTVNNINLTMPRAINSSVANGYRLYPYFGGDEVAPADIHIFIQDLP